MSFALLRSAAVAYGVTLGALVAYNVRWRYLFASSKPRKLPVVIVESEANGKKKNVVIVLIHGMWHDASYYRALQTWLAQRGYTSYAVSLLPGERLLPGGTQRELVRDLECTLADLDKFVLVGHSQGGLVTQSVLQNSKVLKENCVGAVLMGTYPLSYQAGMSKIQAQPQTMYSDVWGFGWICTFGKLLNIRYTKFIFLLPTTDETKEPMKTYLQSLLKAPSDGFITSTHVWFTEKVPIATNIPILVLGASKDVIYPPSALKEGFDERFPQAQHIVAPNQAHCFVDAGWQQSMAEPLVKWLEKHV